MDFLGATLLKDLSRWRQDTMAIALWLLIPLLIGGLITAMADQDNGGGPSGTVLIADLDDTFASGMLAGAFGQSELSDILAAQAVTVDEGTALIEAGEASAFLTIPEGFQDAFVDNEPVTLTLKTNPSQTILPGIVQDVTEILLDAGFYLQALFGDEIAGIKDADIPDTPSDLFVSEMAVTINDKMETVAPLVFPPILSVEIVEPPPEEPKPDIALLFLPGIAMMALMFSAQGLSSDYWKERDQGTLQRLVSTSGRLNYFVIGKSLAASVVIGVVTGATLLAGFLYSSIEWSKFIPSLSWLLIAGIGFFAWFAALQMLFSNNKAANLASTIVLFPLLMMGGSFFPLDALPDWLASIGRVSPNGFVVDKLTTELTSAGDWTFSARDWAVVVIATLVGMAVCARRLAAGFARR